MNIILIGSGRIGSTLAYHLAKDGHDVTVVARGARLDALRREGAIVTLDGRSAAVGVAASFDPATACDLAIVTMPEYQVAPLLPQLAGSQARTVLFMFNTFQGTGPYRDAVGAERFAFGFPKMAAFLDDQRLRFQVDAPGMVTTLSQPALVDLFAHAGLPAELEHDMDSFLRTHVAFVLPLFLAGLTTWARQGGLSWTEAWRLDAAWSEGFGIVRQLGHRLRPRLAMVVARMPRPVRTALLYLFSRTRAVRDVGGFGPAETRHLIDGVAALAPGQASRLLSLRP